MQLDFLLTSSPPVDSLSPGNGTAGANRYGASQCRSQKAVAEDVGSFDSALESARARHKAAGPPSSGSREVDADEKSARRSPVNQSDSTAPDNPPEGGCAVQESQSSDDEDPKTDAPAYSTAEGAATNAKDFSPDSQTSAGEVFTRLEVESDPAVAKTAVRSGSALSRSSNGDRSADGLTVDAAKAMLSSTGESEPASAVASRQEEVQTAGDPTESGEETKVFQGTDSVKEGLQTVTTKPQPSATVTVAPATDVAIDATITDASVKTDAVRSEKNGHRHPAENGTEGSTEKAATPGPAPSDRGDSPSIARVGALSSVINASHAGEDASQKFGNDTGRNPETYRGEPQASEKGTERPLWSTYALQAEAGGYQESSAATASRSGAEPDQKVAEMLLAPQRAVDGDGEATATTETGGTHHPKDLRAETLDQIVNRAVFRLRNGQSEVRIDLKPDTLGHVRLQIVTENHQVTLRIMAESHTAKNLIDSGIGQLKADLQAQGLRVDELDVSVASEFNDFNRHSAFSDRAAQARRMPSTGRQDVHETGPAAVLKPVLENRSTAGVDCFV